MKYIKKGVLSVTVSEYIQIIMTLEEAVQHVVMTAIQEVSPSWILSETVRRYQYWQVSPS